jgi:hypothetical protein
MYVNQVAAGVGISGKSTGHWSPIIIVVVVIAVVIGAIQLIRRK